MTDEHLNSYEVHPFKRHKEPLDPPVTVQANEIQNTEQEIVFCVDGEPVMAFNRHDVRYWKKIDG